ncbi:MAG: hypothetical protein J0L78_16140 [Planctomycetes bacterium]|nr:hypothetical protein [Planctomycetota bacterium]
MSNMACDLSSSTIVERPWRQICVALVVIISTVWIVSGVSKLLWPSEFASVVQHHGLVSATLAHWSWTVGAIELCIGIALLVLWDRPSTRWVVWTSSFLFVGVLVVYIWNVPTEGLAEVGCGCVLLMKRTLNDAEAVRTRALLFDFAFALVHLLLAALFAVTRNSGHGQPDASGAHGARASNVGMGA